MIQAGNLTEAGEARLRTMLSDVRRLRSTVAERIKAELEEDMEGLAATEAEWETSMLQGATPVAVSFASVPAATLKAVAGSPSMACRSRAGLARWL